MVTLGWFALAVLTHWIAFMAGGWMGMGVMDHEWIRDESDTARQITARLYRKAVRQNLN